MLNPYQPEDYRYQLSKIIFSYPKTGYLKATELADRIQIHSKKNSCQTLFFLLFALLHREQYSRCWQPPVFLYRVVRRKAAR